MCLDCGGAHGENPHRLGRTRRTCGLHADRPQLVELIPVAQPLLFLCIYFPTLNIKCLNIKFPQSCQSSALFTAAVFILFETQRDALSGLFCSWNSITRDRKRGHLTSDQQRAAAWVKPTSHKLTFHFCSSGWRSSLKPRRQECDCDLFVFVVTHVVIAVVSDLQPVQTAVYTLLQRLWGGKNFIIQSQKCCNSHF